jgi:phage baseplate assembly protein W
MSVRPSRADVISPKQKQSEFFSDFLNSFMKTPVGDELARVTNEQSVNQSLRNLIKTNLGERLFQPDIGSNVRASLFQPLDPSTSETLRFYIESVIGNNERRVNLLQVEVQTFFDQRETGIYKITSEHEISITIYYTLINSTTPITLSMILRRVR